MFRQRTTFSNWASTTLTKIKRRKASAELSTIQPEHIQYRHFSHSCILCEQYIFTIMESRVRVWQNEFYCSYVRQILRNISAYGVGVGLGLWRSECGGEWANELDNMNIKDMLDK